MFCYFRHIRDILDESGISVTPANKKQVDQSIHQAVGVAYKNCPATWEKIKEGIENDRKKRQALIAQLQTVTR